MKTLILTLCFITQAFAISEHNYRETFSKEVTPYFESFHQDSFRNSQGMNLHFYSLKNPAFKKTLIILPGRTEPAQKYAELAFDLKGLEMNVFILDIQGQGESDRLLSDTQKGHVRKFNDYVLDLKQFLNEIVIPQTRGTDLYILSHSMGGTIAAKYLASENHLIKKAVLNAPMFEMNTAPYKEWIARIYSNVLVVAGKGTTYAPGRGPYNPQEDSFEKNDVTHSRARFEHYKQTLLDRPELIVAGPTARWVRESLNATKGSQSLGKKIHIPLLVLQAQNDQIVHLPRQAQFCDNARNCKAHVFKNSFHEILMEKDLIRDEALSLIESFFSK